MNKGQATILVIDDDPDFVAATRTVLESSGYKVIVASEGSEGLRKARENIPDLIVLDVIMPVKTGIAVSDELKRDPELKKIPVIMLTSLGQRLGEVDISRQDALTLEAEDYIDKPVQPSELLKRVANQLNKGKAA